MACPKQFFDRNEAYIRISEIASFGRQSGGLYLVITLRDGREFKHRDYNGSVAKMEQRLISAITAVEDL